MNIPFVKMHANGNDFVIIDNRIKKLYLKNFLSSLSNRNTGIGFDQLILLENSNNNDVLMKIYNSDGTEAKMCGNAASCVASLLFASKNTNSISIETISAKLIAELNKNGGIRYYGNVASQNFLDIIINQDIDVTNIDLSKIHLLFHQEC